MIVTRLSAALLLLPFVACVSGTGAAAPASAPGATPTAAASPAPPTAPAVPANDLLNATLWTQRAVEHDLVLVEIYRNATEKLAAAIADPSWSALARDDRESESASQPTGLAVILDVDEAVLDNSPYQARLVLSGDEYNEFSWKKWCHEESAKALPGAVEFTQYAAAHGVAVYFVTNRAKDLDQATLANLRKAGFPVASDDAFLGLGTVVTGCEQYGSDKGCRRRFVGRTHRVLMQFGDQIDDFVDVISNTRDDRAKSIEPYMDWIGSRWWVLPNPSYGSWEPAQFNNDWSASRESRRKAKIEALRPN